MSWPDRALSQHGTRLADSSLPLTVQGFFSPLHGCPFTGLGAGVSRLCHFWGYFNAKSPLQREKSGGAGSGELDRPLYRSTEIGAPVRVFPYGANPGTQGATAVRSCSLPLASNTNLPFRCVMEGLLVICFGSLSHSPALATANSGRSASLKWGGGGEKYWGLSA